MPFKQKFILPVAAAMLMASCGGQSASASGLSVSQSASASGLSSSQSASASGLSVSQSASGLSSSTPAHKEDHVMQNPVEITFWSTFNDTYQTQLQNFVTAFKEVEPNITVNVKKETGSYDDIKNKVIENIAIGNHPDLAVVYPDAVQEMMDYDAVVQLDDYIENPVYGWTEEDLEDVIPAYIEEGQSYPAVGTFSVPIAKSSEGMYYNASVLIGLNLSAEDATINAGRPLDHNYLDNLTWEELFGKLAPALIAHNDKLPDEEKYLKTKEGSNTAVFAYDSDDNLFITLAQQYGYGYTGRDATTGKGSILFKNDGMKNMMKTLNEAYKNGYFITKGINNGNYTNELFTAHQTLFSVGSTGGQAYQHSDDFDTAVARIPHAEGKEFTVINQGPSIAILDHNNDDRALASWLFYRFITTAKNAGAWAMNTGYSPIRYSTMDDPEFADYASIEGKAEKTIELLNARCVQYSYSITDSLYISPVFKGSATARTQVGALLPKLVGDKDLTQEKIDAEFDKAYNNTLAKM